MAKIQKKVCQFGVLGGVGPPERSDRALTCPNCVPGTLEALMTLYYLLRTCLGGPNPTEHPTKYPKNTKNHEKYAIFDILVLLFVSQDPINGY